ncbi:DUF4244 domain-containing protein [Streptomyces sp. JJ36]|nr:DUF4244 domain-containing protein [Streptomyces sp. JJ36]
MKDRWRRAQRAVRGRGARYRDRLWRALRRGDCGMSTAEYAVGTIAACGFAAVLYKIVNSGAVSEGLQKIIEKALDAAG